MLPDSFLANVNVFETAIVPRLLDRHDGYSYFYFSTAELYRTRQDTQYRVCVLSLQFRTRYEYRTMSLARANRKGETLPECGSFFRLSLGCDRAAGYGCVNILRIFNRCPRLDQEHFRLGLSSMHITDLELVFRYQRLSAGGLAALLNHYNAFYTSNGKGVTVIPGSIMFGDMDLRMMPLSMGWLCRLSRRRFQEHLARIIVSIFLQSRERRRPRKRVKVTPLVNHLTEDNLALLIADYAVAYMPQ